MGILVWEEVKVDVCAFIYKWEKSGVISGSRKGVGLMAENFARAGKAKGKNMEKVPPSRVLVGEK